ncbi:MAG TPA: Holliday junction resolvase RuvX [Methylomirabilota bacterium]|nr:Holliday junction resolvase RuvX [Methylomirabilota bacterium]
MASSPRSASSAYSGSAASAAPVLAIDYGRKRWGLALSDVMGLISRPLATWNRTNRRRDLARLRELVRLHSVRRIVVGLPLQMDGTPSEMSEEASRFALRLRKELGLPVELLDERLTSWEAGREVRRAGRSPGIDALAATVILREYLARQSGQATAVRSPGTGS